MYTSKWLSWDLTQSMEVKGLLELQPKAQGGKDRKEDCPCRLEPYYRGSSIINKTWGFILSSAGNHCRVVIRGLPYVAFTLEGYFADSVENRLVGKEIRSKGKERMYIWR